MNSLTDSDYINDTALIEALRIPQPPPAGQTGETRPLWHRPDPAGDGPNGPGVRLTHSLLSKRPFRHVSTWHFQD